MFPFKLGQPGLQQSLRMRGSYHIITVLLKGTGRKITHPIYNPLVVPVNSGLLMASSTLSAKLIHSSCRALTQHAVNAPAERISCGILRQAKARGADCRHVDVHHPSSSAVSRRDVKRPEVKHSEAGSINPGSPVEDASPGVRMREI
jgi:hypothetical protein